MTMPFWNKHIETLPHDELEDLQVKRLKDTVARCRKTVFYRNRLKGIDESQFSTPEDVSCLLYTSDAADE